MSDKFQGGIKAGSTDVTVSLELRSKTDSTELTGLTHSDVTLSYWRPGGTPTAITPASLAAIDSAHSDGGFKEVSASAHAGLYRLDLPDAAVAIGADSVVISVTTASGFVQHFEYPLTTNVIQTGDSFARLGAPAGASVSADLATIDANVDAILSDTGTDLPATLGTIAGYLDTEIASIKAKTDNLPASPASTGDVTGAVSGLATASALSTLDGKVVVVDGIVDAIKAVTDNLPDSGALTTLLSNLAAALADTNELQTDWVNGGRLDLLVDAIKAKTDNLPAAPASTGDVTGAVSGLATASALATVDANVDAIKAVTDKVDTGLEADGATGYQFTALALENAPAGGGGGGDATAANQASILAALATVDGVVDAIKAVTDNLPDGGALTTLNGNVVLALADTNELQTDWVNGGRLDLLVDAIKAKTDNLPAAPASTGDVTGAVSGLATASALATVDANVDAIKAVTDKVDTGLEADGATGYQFTALALENAPAGGGGGGDATAANQASILAAIAVVDANVDAIREDTESTLPAAIAAIDSGSGSGAYAITVTVKDEADAPVENALVRLKASGGLPYFATTNASGVATFSLDAATYTRTIVADGLQYAADTLVVTADASVTCVMEARAIPAAPDDAATCRVYGYLETLDNRPAANVSITFELIRGTRKGPLASDKLLDLTPVTVTTDANGRIVDSDGNFYVDLQRTDEVSPTGAYYRVDCPALQLNHHKLALAATTYDLSGIAG